MSGLTFRTFALAFAVTLPMGLQAAQSLAAQTSSAAGVTIKVAPRNLQGVAWEFDVTFDTHSQDLNDNLLKSAALVNADGTQVRPVAWQGDPAGGHHRKGVLRFDAIAPVPAKLEMQITRPGEPKPRSYRWTLK